MPLVGVGAFLSSRPKSRKPRVLPVAPVGFDPLDVTAVNPSPLVGWDGLPSPQVRHLAATDDVDVIATRRQRLGCPVGGLTLDNNLPGRRLQTAGEGEIPDGGVLGVVNV